MPNPPPTLGDAIPKELAEVLKREFNTGIPQIATLGGVVFGTFGYKSFDAPVWTVVAIITFFLIFLLQQQIPSRIPQTLGIVIILLGCTAAILLVCHAYSGSSMDFWDWCEAHGKSTTGALSAGIISSIALLSVSYKKQQRWSGMRYPDLIENAVTNQLNSSRFYKENVVFRIEVKHSDGQSVDFETTLSYDVTNRSEDQNTWLAEYELNDPVAGRFIEVKINDLPEDITKFHGARLVRASVLIEAHKMRTVAIKVKDRFRIIDSDLYTSYHPATDLRVEFVNTKDLALDVEFDLLHVSKYEEKQENLKTFVQMSDGILPFEGIRLRWRPRQ
jgi:hypothetical protein